MAHHLLLLGAMACFNAWGATYWDKELGVAFSRDIPVFEMRYRYGVLKAEIYRLEPSREVLVGTYHFEPKMHKEMRIALDEPGRYRATLYDVRNASASKTITIDRSPPLLSVEAVEAARTCAGDLQINITGMARDEDLRLGRLGIAVLDNTRGEFWDGKDWSEPKDRTRHLVPPGSLDARTGKWTWAFRVAHDRADNIGLVAYALDIAGNTAEAPVALPRIMRKNDADCP